MVTGAYHTEAMVDPYEATVVIDPYEATVDAATVAMETTYYYLSAAQTAPEHREVAPG